MDFPKQMASEAVAAAPKALDVALAKPTEHLCPKQQTSASAFSHSGGEL